MLHEADPTTGEADPPDMPRLEQQVIIFRRGFMFGLFKIATFYFYHLRYLRWGL